MRSFAYVVLILSIFAATAFAAKCTVGNSVLSPGQSIKHPEADCALLVCQDDGETQYEGCAIPALSPGCREVEPQNPRSAYPACCTRVICN